MTPKERAAKAIEETMFAPHELPLPADLHVKYSQTTAAALAAIATPSEAMIEDAGISMREAEAARYGEITMEDLFVVGWRAAHAAMLAEKDTRE